MKRISNSFFRLVWLIVLLTSGYGFDAYSYSRTYEISVGDVIDVFATPRSNTISVLWTYDSNVVRPVTPIYKTTTHVRFEAVAKSAAYGSVIQATTYYTYSGGSGKTFEDYLVVVKDKENEPENPPAVDVWSPTLSLSSNSVKVGETVIATARVSPSGYRGEYRWRFFTGGGAVEVLDWSYRVGDYYITDSNSISFMATKVGECYISVYLENGQCYSKTLEIIKETDDDIIRNLRFGSVTAIGECGDIWEIPVYFDEIISSTRSAGCSSSNPSVAVVNCTNVRTFDSATSKSGRYKLEIKALSPGETTIRFSYGGVQAANDLKLTVFPAWSEIEGLTSGYESIQRSLGKGNQNYESLWRISSRFREGPAFGDIYLETGNIAEEATPFLERSLFLVMAQDQLLQPNSLYSLHIPKDALQKVDGRLNEKDYEIKFITGIGKEPEGGKAVYMVTDMDDWNLENPTYFIPETVRTDSKIVYEREILFPQNESFSFKFIPKKGSWIGGFGNDENEGLWDLRLTDRKGFNFSSIGFETDEPDDLKMKCKTDDSTVLTKITITKQLNSNTSWPWSITFQRGSNAGIDNAIANEDSYVEKIYYDLLGNKIAVPQKGHFYLVIEGDKREKVLY